MQAHGAAQGAGTTIPRRGRRLLEALLAIAAILVIVALMALMTRGMGAPADTGGVGAQDAKAGVVGSAIVHDDTGIMHASMVKDMGQMRGTDPGKVAPLNAGAAVIHDDAGNVR
ncbi:MAG TPA: hypothetical protein VJ827_05680 [Rubrobacter sp.]|nr:hypothetical protein [Rubrobacter sp.]